MQFGTLPFQYLGWHYTIGIKDFYINSRSLIQFLFNFFSVRTLLRTFFAPWRRLGEHYQKQFDPSAWAQTFILNTIVRVIGIALRTILLLFALATISLAILASLVALAFWLVWPLLIAVLFLSGLNLLLS